MYKPWSSTVSAPLPPLDRPVWVHLDRLYGPPDSPGPVADPVPGGYLAVLVPASALTPRDEEPRR